MARMQRSLFAQLNALAEEISQGSVKAAAEKKAGPVPADPGGYQGASTHPSVSVGNDVQDAETGARASEYEADVKEQQGVLAVDNTPEMSQEGRQDDVQLDIGAHAAATGEDPAAEKDYKGTKDDPGTAHPAKTNDGEKYSGVSFKTARDQCAALGNDILANLINFGTGGLKAAEEGLVGDQHKLDTDNDGKIEGADLAALRSGEKAEEKDDDDDDDDDDKEAAAAGYGLAAALGINKKAAVAAVQDVCANTLREADEMADLLIGFMSGKQANADVLDEAAAAEDHGMPADAASGMGDAPPAAGGVEELLGAEGSPEMGAGEPTEDEAVQELAMALEELGIPPEALLEAVAEGGGGPGGPEAAGMPPEAAGMPPEAAGMPPEAAGMPMEEPKMAAARDLRAIGQAVVNFKRAGRFQVKEARTKRSRQLRDIMKQHVIELVNR